MAGPFFGEKCRPSLKPSLKRCPGGRPGEASGDALSTPSCGPPAVIPAPIYTSPVNVVWLLAHHSPSHRSLNHLPITHTYTYAAKLLASSSPAVRLTSSSPTVLSPSSTYVIGRTAQHLHRPQAAPHRLCSSASFPHTQRENTWLPPCSLLDAVLLHHMSEVVGVLRSLHIAHLVWSHGI